MAPVCYSGIQAPGESVGKLEVHSPTSGRDLGISFQQCEKEAASGERGLQSL